MGDSGDQGGAATPPTVLASRGASASRAALLGQRKSEVQDAAVVGSLVKVVYAEAWTNRAGAAMSSGYGKQVLKRKLCHIGGGLIGGELVFVLPIVVRRPAPLI